MGKLNIFEITFANMTGIFYSGNFVDGNVTVELTQPMKMRGIQLKFEGKAYVHWTERHSSGSGKNRKTHTRHYSATEIYFNQDVLLFGIWSGQGSNTTELQTGRHTFPFRFQLPQGLPSSFEGGIGHVRYSVSSKIDKPWKFDHKTKRLFTVISILDLNTQPAYCQRCSGNNQKHLCCLCCKSGPITAQFSIERQGWVPGEAMKLYADISNGASRQMDQSYVDLKMITTFHATSKSKTSTQEVARVTRPSIPGFGEDSWTGEQMVIPPLPPSFLVGCNIIDIQYVLQLNVDPSGPALDLEVPLPIVIGTIPLMSVIQQAPPMAPVMPPPGQYGMGDQAMPPQEALYPPNPTPGFPDLPPPSYSECITGRVNARDDDDNEHTRGNLEFAPAYTYYNWGHQPAAMPEEMKKN